jgi:hypothetical protein
MKIGPVGAEFHADGQTVIVLLAEFSVFGKCLPEYEKNSNLQDRVDLTVR